MLCYTGLKHLLSVMFHMSQQQYESRDNTCKCAVTGSVVFNSECTGNPVSARLRSPAGLTRLAGGFLAGSLEGPSRQDMEQMEARVGNRKEAEM